MTTHSLDEKKMTGSIPLLPILSREHLREGTYAAAYRVAQDAGASIEQAFDLSLIAINAVDDVYKAVHATASFACITTDEVDATALAAANALAVVAVYAVAHHTDFAIPDTDMIIVNVIGIFYTRFYSVILRPEGMENDATYDGATTTEAASGALAAVHCLTDVYVAAHTDASRAGITTKDAVLIAKTTVHIVEPVCLGIYDAARQVGVASSKAVEMALTAVKAISAVHHAVVRDIHSAKACTDEKKEGTVASREEKAVDALYHMIHRDISSIVCSSGMVNAAKTAETLTVIITSTYCSAYRTACSTTGGVCSALKAASAVCDLYLEMYMAALKASVKATST